MENLKQIIQNFKVPEKEYRFSVISNGLINDTYLVSEGEIPVYILQRINTNVFTKVSSLIQNIDLVLPLLKGKDYSKIEMIKSVSGDSFFKDQDDVWRVMTYIRDSHVYNTTTDPKVAYEAGRIIGEFHKKTRDLNAGLLEDTLPGFHDLHLRYAQFKTALSQAKSENIRTAQKAIDFVNENISALLDIQFETLPLRVCHNDTKLNNILFSKDNKALCLIDLDTLMKGYFLYDFGDAVRTIANTAPEDEIDLKKINFTPELFNAFIDGLSESKEIFKKEELDQLSLGAALMPFLHGIRALTDYLENNRYYKVQYETQNLDRCNSLFTFSKLVLRHQDQMTGMIKKKLG